MDDAADRRNKRRQDLPIHDFATLPRSQSPPCSAQQHQSSFNIPNNQFRERTEKRQHRLSLRGILNPSSKRERSDAEHVRKPRCSIKNIEAGLMRDNSRRSGLTGNTYQQQNRSELSLPGAFRMTPSGLIDDDPSVLSANTRETNTLYIPNASLVGDSRNIIPMTDYDFERTVGVGVPIRRSPDGMYMNVRQIRLLFLFLGAIVIALVLGLVVAVNKRASEELPSASDSSNDFLTPLDWSDDKVNDPDNLDPKNDTMIMGWTDQPTPSPSAIRKEIKSDLGSHSPSGVATNPPTGAPARGPSIFPVTSPPTVNAAVENEPLSRTPTSEPITARPLSPIPSFPPSALPSYSPSLRPVSMRPSFAPQSSAPSLPPTSILPASPHPSLPPTLMPSLLPSMLRKPGNRSNGQENSDGVGNGNG